MYVASSGRVYVKMRLFWFEIGMVNQGLLALQFNLEKLTICNIGLNVIHDSEMSRIWSLLLAVTYFVSAAESSSSSSTESPFFAGMASMDNTEDQGADHYVLYFDGNCSVLQTSALDDFSVFLRVNLASKLYLLYDLIHVHSLSCSSAGLEANVSFGQGHRQRVEQILDHLVDTRSPIVEYGGIYFNLSASHLSFSDDIKIGGVYPRGRNNERSVNRIDVLGLGGDGGDVESVLAAQEATDDLGESGPTSKLSKMELGLMVFLFTCGGLFLLLTLLLGVMKLSSIGLINSSGGLWYPHMTSDGNVQEDATLILGDESRLCKGAAAYSDEEDYCACGGQQFYQQTGPLDSQSTPEYCQEDSECLQGAQTQGTCCYSEVNQDGGDVTDFPNLAQVTLNPPSSNSQSRKSGLFSRRRLTKLFNAAATSISGRKQYKLFHQSTSTDFSESRQTGARPKLSRGYKSVDALCLQETAVSSAAGGSEADGGDTSLHI